MVRADSRGLELPQNVRIRWIVTSPPYYGMRTYVPDQWLRNWFVGGPPEVEYGQRDDDISHASPESFASQLGQVWERLANVSDGQTRLVIRFGSIGERQVDPLLIIRELLTGSGWRLTTVRKAGDASDGHRQARQFRSVSNWARIEYDFYGALSQVTSAPSQ